MIKYEMNKFFQSIHKNQLIIYQKYDEYYVIDNGVYILKGLLDFKYCLKYGRKIIFIDNNYLNYVLSCLRKSQVSYVVIGINYGYEKIFEYKACYNRYCFYYKRGKRLIKNLRKLEFILEKLEKSRNIDLLREIEMIIDDNSY